MGEYDEYILVMDKLGYQPIAHARGMNINNTRSTWSFHSDTVYNYNQAYLANNNRFNFYEQSVGGGYEKLWMLQSLLSSKIHGVCVC